MGAWEDKNKRIVSVCEYAKKQKQKERKADLARFIEAFYAPSAPDDILTTSIAELYAVAKSIYELALKRKPGQTLVNVFNPNSSKDGWSTSHTVVQIINDDVPFLVDSVMGSLTVTRKIGIHTLLHPMIRVKRNAKGLLEETLGAVGYKKAAEDEAGRESYIFVVIDRISDKAALKELQVALADVCNDVHISVKDWRPITKKALDAVKGLKACPSSLDKDAAIEASAFMEWLTQDHFTFIGYREYRFDGDPIKAVFKPVKGSGLGILRDPNRHIFRGEKGLTSASNEIRDALAQPDPIIITKANVKTQVHRPVHLDYIGVKIFDKKGQVVGERRFAGLFTSLSYSKRAEDIPLIRRKVQNVQKRAFYNPASHAGKALMHILETFPRDELFQVSEDKLLEISLGILHLMERPRAKAFFRLDKFERFVSALVFVPREQYNSDLRVEIGNIIADAFNGEISVYFAQLNDVTLARWHFIIRTKPGNVANPDFAEIDRKIAAAAKPWHDYLRDEMVQRFGDEKGYRIYERHAHVFPLAYREAFTPFRAAEDMLRIEELRKPTDMIFDLYRLDDDPLTKVRLKILHASETVPLSECLPRLEHLGLKVISEHAYAIRNEFNGCVHDFEMESVGDIEVDVDATELLVEELLLGVWHGEIEDDGLNALALKVGMPAYKIVILRAYMKYLRQIGLPFSQHYVQLCMAKYADISRKLVSIFEAMFDPKFGAREERLKKVKLLSSEIKEALDKVESLDEDRILRNFLNVMLATLRTNFYQDSYANGTGINGIMPGLSLKIRSDKVELVPKPKPYAEIFVYSPRFEGIHLRGGPVARGGLRWSDRPEDFRTEVLGLVKAQMVKNAVIVPIGAKGGFVPKHLDKTTNRQEFIEEGTACYKSFITSLLTITDNLVKGKITPPKKVTRWDKGDPYLVVAADKGTATFSDTANGIAIGHGFWLGDAFASGGSVGYDHKKMGITARGAWVSVARHFRELGKNIQTESIDVIGIGDMSGDVFGNGMLLSKALKLKVAFDHRHIFFDPDPDPEKSWEERKRLFKLPRSSWADYKKSLISKGGGIYERSMKSVPLNDEFRAFLGIEDKALSPTELINRVLKSKADLLWIGGIGTYVKATAESHGDVGDRANDALRVNAKDLKVKAVGEGGNLGMTQRSRIEFSRLGGRLNTDFIDNSAGVDCSDKEVNIKILLEAAKQTAGLSEADRVKLLAKMTNEVGLIVLEDNYLQTQAISIAESKADREREQHAGLIRVLEREGRLDREIEFLPTEEQFAELAVNQEGLTRPEIAVITSYTKMSLFDILLQSKILDDPVLQPELEWGFPKILRKQFAKQLSLHQLRREIIATTLANEIVNRGGLTFTYNIKEETGLAVDQIAAAFIIVREVFGLDDIWESIDALDYKVPSEVQIKMHSDLCDFTQHQTIWFLRNFPKPLDIKKLISLYSEGLKALLAKPELVLSPIAKEYFEERCNELKGHGVPAPLARKVAAFEVMPAASDIVNVAGTLKRKVGDVGTAYFEVGHRAGFDWLRQKTEDLKGEDRWDVLAIRSVVEELADMQRELTRIILAQSKSGSGCQAVDKWMHVNGALEPRAERLINDLKSSGPVNVAKLSFAARHIRSILPL